MHKSETLNIIRFGSVADLGAYCLEHDVHNSGGGGASTWTAGLSAEQAAKLCITGDSSQVAEAEKLMEKFSTEIHTTQYEDMPSVAGCYPCVPEALTGEPECMREPQLVEATNAPLHILADLTSSAVISAAQMRRRGIAILSLVMALAATRAITLEVACVMFGKKRKDADGDRFSIVSARIETAPLDLATAAHAITNVGVARHLFYGLAEEFDYGGMWPRFAGWDATDPESPEYIAKMRKYLEISDDVLIIPAAINTNQKIITMPEKWVLEHVEKFENRA
jgi:hypothetical protein